MRTRAPAKEATLPAKGSRAGPNRRGAVGDNSKNSDDAIIKKAAEAHADIEARVVAFRTKVALRREKEVRAPLAGIGIKMKYAKDSFANHIIETGKDDDAVQKAANDRALRLDTQNRIHAALHDGEQLDFLKAAEQAERARKEAEDGAGKADEETDDDGSGETE